MEEKANLMVQSQNLGLKIEQLNVKIAEIQKELQEIPVECRREQANAASEAMKAFNRNKQRLVRSVSDTVSKKRQSIQAMIGKMPNQGQSEIIGSRDIAELESHLKKIYPEDLITDFICLNPIEFSSDEEASNVCNSVKEEILHLHQNNFVGSTFNNLMALFDKAADYDDLGIKVAGAATLFIIGGLCLSPFLFLTTFALMGLIGGLQGKYVGTLLKQIYSVKLYENDVYDEEKFAEDMSDTMDIVTDYLESIKKQALDSIEAMEFKVDPSLATTIQNRFDVKTQRLQKYLSGMQQELSVAQEELESLVKEIEKLSLREKNLADAARQKYLGEITWKKEWMEKIFLEVSPENKVRVCKYGQCNSIYYSDNAECLKSFSRLLIYQSMLHMHPDFVSNVVLDYKYNGGSLMQFSTVSARCCKLCYSPEDIADQITSLDNRIRARTTNILSTCSSIEEFNALMESYNSNGEYFIVVHVFGKTDWSSQFLNNLRNGPRVGIYYKFYWTLEEMGIIKNDVPFDDVNEFFEIKDNPLPRTTGALRRALGL